MLKILYIVILSSILVVSVGNKFNPFGSCLQLFIPADLTTSCAAHTHDIVRIIKNCIKERPFKAKHIKSIPNELSTCEQAKCATGKYGVLNSNGQVTMQRARKLLNDLDLKGDLITKKANKLVLEYCVDKDYRMFLSKEPQCTQWSFLNCLFWAYRLVNHVNEDLQWMGRCKTIYENGKACFSRKDQFYQYLAKDFTNKWKGQL